MSAVTPYNKDNISLFQPNQVAGLALWLDAADSSSVITSGSNVTAWNDKSSNAHICISNANYVGTTLPTYNSNAAFKNVNFAPSQVLVTSSNWNYVPSWSCFVALNTVSLAPRWLISPFSGVSLVMMGMNQGISKIFSGAFPSGTTDITGNHIEYTSAENTNASSNLLWYRDGVIQASNVRSQGVAAGTTKMGIGGNATFSDAMGGTYQLYEVLIFNSYLSPSNRQQIESYLAYKWNLQASLPTTHPYYASPYNAYPPFTNINQITKFAYPVLPSDIGGLALWLDAADGATVITSGSSVTRWNDKSGNGFNMSNNASYQSPTYNTTGFNGKPTISFFRNSSNSFTILENTGFSFTSNSVTLFFISQRNIAGTTTTYQRFFSVASNINGTDNNSGVFNINSFGGISLERSTYLTSAFTTTNPFLGEVIINGTASAVGNFNTVTNYIYANGSQIGGSTTPTAGSNFNIVHVRLGAATNTSSGNDIGFESLQGNMSEVLLFNRVLTTSEFRQIEAYLAWKWGLQANLPSTHPYYNNAFIPNMNVSIPTTVTIYQYSPKSLSGLALWLDAADAASVSVSPGTQNVTGWNDKSGNGKNFTTVAGSPTYTSASQGIFFNGTNLDCMQSSSVISYTSGVTSLFVVTKITATNAGYAYVIVFGNGVDYSLRYNGPFNGNDVIYGNIWYLNGNTQSVGTTLPGSIINATTLINGLVNSTASTVLQLSLGPASVSQPWAGRYLTGFIQEVIIISTAITTIQRQQVEGYLAWKWSLVSSLPSNHPYKLYPP